MRRRGRWTWIVLLVVVVVLALPMPIAERYTSPTQNGQYLFHPWQAYRFVWTAASTSGSSRLNTSGEALAEAKRYFKGSTVRPTSVELLFFPGPGTYTYSTTRGDILTVKDPNSFAWEVWGTDTSDGGSDISDVVGLIDHKTGKMLASTG